MKVIDPIGNYKKLTEFMGKGEISIKRLEFY